MYRCIIYDIISDYYLCEDKYVYSWIVAIVDVVKGRQYCACSML